ncbi:unnamed protein product [marine sediment metagenome]|uniref:Thiamine-binding protein domain-containing protein n=1 Tax=marine sediment metagenome TaxID=412755 RepID=X1UY23_9ZZZZ
MTIPQTEKSKPELCTIRIMFPVVSDDEAIMCKKRIAEALSDIPDMNIQFSIMNMPTKPNMGM